MTISQLLLYCFVAPAAIGLVVGFFAAPSKQGIKVIQWGAALLGGAIALAKILVQTQKMPPEKAFLFSGPLLALGIFIMLRSLVIFVRGVRAGGNQNAP